MKPQPLTYAMLLEGQQKLIELEQLNPQTFANRATALRQFLIANHLNEDDVVGLEMRPHFPLAVSKMAEKLQSAGRSSRSISNTKSALSSWKQAVVRFDIETAYYSNLPTPFLTLLRATMKDQSVTMVSKQSGIPVDMLSGWLQGKSPRASSAKYVSRLEVFFGLERHSLVGLAGFAVDAREKAALPPAIAVEFRERQKNREKKSYWLSAEPGSPLRSQWLDLLKYKTELVPELERTKRGQWTVSELNAVRQTESNWYLFLDGKEVPAAYAVKAKLFAYLGFLGLSVEEGGIGIKPEYLQTLAWAAVPDYVDRYLRWTKKRAGDKTTRGAIQFIATLTMLVRPETGYLYQQPHFLKTLPVEYQSLDWQELCLKQFKYLAKMEAALSYQVTSGRDSFAPIRHILDLEQPMEAIADMVQRMRADRPMTCASSDAIWARDIFLVKICCSNPLRRRNIACLEWSPDNRDGRRPSDKCSLYQRVDGAWWIFVPKHLLKNRKGEQIDDYDSPVHPSVRQDLERYLFQHRPVLQKFPTDLVFLARGRDPSRTGTVKGTGNYTKAAPTEHRPFLDYSKRLFELTKKYLWRCDGIGSHAFRHLVATSILKSPGGDIKTAALVLNDSELTVHKAYSGMRSGDGAARMGELLGKTFARM